MAIAKVAEMKDCRIFILYLLAYAFSAVTIIYLYFHEIGRLFSGYVYLYVGIFFLVSVVILFVVDHLMFERNAKLARSFSIVAVPYLSATISYYLMIFCVAILYGGSIVKHGVFSVILVGLYFPYVAIKGLLISLVFYMVLLLFRKFKLERLKQRPKEDKVIN